MKWGIVGCGSISNDFVNSLNALGPETAVVACGARSMSSATGFGTKHKIKKCYSSYKEVCHDTDVEVVYIGTIHTMHFEHCKLAINAGKHVLCEKPMGMNASEVEVLKQLATDRKVFLMEGMWTRFFPIVRKVRRLLKDGIIGEVLTVNADFGVYVPKSVERLWKLELGGGALLDLGIYPIAFISMVFDGQFPEEIHAAGGVSPSTGTDMYSNILLKYSGNRTGTAQVSCLATTPEEVHITGTAGRIKIHSPAHIPEALTIYRYGKTREDVSEETISISHPRTCDLLPPFCYPGGTGFQFEGAAVEECINAGMLQHPEYSLEESVTVNKILDECRKQLGVVYPQD